MRVKSDPQNAWVSIKGKRRVVECDLGVSV